MYSFPIFNSSPLVQARLHRARRAAGKFGGCGGSGVQVPSGNHHHPAASAVVVDAIAKPPSVGPIRARNLLRIQSGEGLFSEDEHAHGERDGMIISGAFRSGSLEEDEKGGHDQRSTPDGVRGVGWKLEGRSELRRSTMWRASGLSPERCGRPQLIGWFWRLVSGTDRRPLLEPRSWSSSAPDSLHHPRS